MQDERLHKKRQLTDMLKKVDACQSQLAMYKESDPEVVANMSKLGG